MDKYVIQVDLELEDLVPDYLENRKKDLLIFREAMSRNDFNAVAQLAHKIKGSGGGYGFAYLSELGADIETAGNIGDASSIQKGVADLEYYLNHIEVVYK